eukprot:756416-Hanusia_phi.AAC.2
MSDGSVQENELCSKYGVSGYPTIKYFPTGDKEGKPYNGGRSLDDLKKFAEVCAEARRIEGGGWGCGWSEGGREAGRIWRYRRMDAGEKDDGDMWMCAKMNLCVNHHDDGDDDAADGDEDVDAADGDGDEDATIMRGKEVDELMISFQDNLEVKCDVKDPKGCTDKEKKFIDSMQAKSAEDRSKELTRLNGMA